MSRSPFEKFLPWSGALAGIGWTVYLIASKTPDDPDDRHAVAIIGASVARNVVSGFSLLAGALMLVFFAAAARAWLRSGEGGESSYSSVAHGGLLVASVGFGVLGIVEIALTNAARAGDAAATATIGQLALIGWLPALVGLLAAFWALGLGGLRNATMPRWFAVVTLALAVVGVLGPLALGVYLLLPVWLVGASILTASHSRIPEAAPAGAVARAAR